MENNKIVNNNKSSETLDETEIKVTLSEKKCNFAFMLFMKEHMSEFLTPETKEEAEYFEWITAIAKQAFWCWTVAWFTLATDEFHNVLDSE